MAPSYHEIGLALDIVYSDLKTIKRDSKLPDPTQKCYRMLEVWLKKKGTSATWKRLCDALDENDEHELAKNIRETIASS